MPERGCPIFVMACAWCTHRVHLEVPVTDEARHACPLCGRPMFPLTQPPSQPEAIAPADANRTTAPALTAQ